MYKSVASVCMALVAVVVLVGCGGQQPKAPAKEEPKLTASVRTLDEMTVASMAKTGPYTGVGQAIADLFAWAAKANVKPMGMSFGVYSTGPEVPQDSAKWEVCFAVAPETKPDKAAGVEVKKFGGMQIAATLHVGPYDKVQPVYDQLMKWIDENGYLIAGPAVEFYMNDPQTTPAESLKTEVAFVVQAKPEAEETTK